MDTLTAELPGWRSLTKRETEQIGLTPELLTENFLAGREIVAGLNDAHGGAKRDAHASPSREPRRIPSRDARARAGDGPPRAQRHPTRGGRSRDRGAQPAAPTGGRRQRRDSGAGIREIDLDETTGLRTIRFRRPWLGTRHLRVEYEAERAPGTPGPLPGAELNPEFGKERFLVVQSRGAVEVETSPGPGLEAIALEDVPEFSTPWVEGRLLQAFRYRLQGEPGTLSTRLHPRAPVVARLAQEVKLTTIIGREGISRTEAEILLGSPQTQYLEVGLPLDARVLAVEVGGRPVRALRPARASGDRSIVSVPLPPRSYSRIHITYERTSGRSTPHVARWGTATWIERGPELMGTPVGKTTWRIFHPTGYRFVPSDGNVVVTRDPSWRDVPGNFWESFLSPLLTGGSPRLTVTESPRLRSAHSPQASLLQATNNSAVSASSRRLKAQSRQPSAQDDAPLASMIPDGHLIEAEKIGGHPQISLSYWPHRWETASGRGVAALTILAAALVFRIVRDARRRALIYVYSFGLALLAPLALGWHSPLLMVPICEGLLLFGVWWSTAWIVRHVYVWVARRTTRKPATASSAVSWFFILALALAAHGGADAKESPAENSWDGVLIPYDVGNGAEERQAKVYIPREKFAALWRAAREEPPREDETAPADYFTGNVRYDLRVEGTRSRLVARIPVEILTDDWVAFPLDVRHLRIVSVAVDGEVGGVHVENGVPHVPLVGRGSKVVTVELVGRVESELGSFRVRSGLREAPIATLTAHLPHGALVTLRGAAHPGVVEDDGTTTRLVADLGGARDIEILWSFPKRETELGSRLESTSYTRLSPSLDGVHVHRVEKVHITGRPVETVEYTLPDDWTITTVAGDGLTEWTVDVAEGESSVLRVYFGAPVSHADLRISGHSAVGTESPLPALSLVNATRQETFVGLYHGARRTFLAGSVAGMERVSSSALADNFELGEEPPDRLHRAYTSGAGEVIQLGTARGETALTTEAVAVIHSDRLTVHGRSRYNAAHPDVIRYELPLPQGWWIRSVQSSGLRFWEVVTDGNEQRLVAHWSRGVTSGTEIKWVAEERFDDPPARLTLPPLRVIDATGTLRQTVEWTFAAATEYDLSALARERWEASPAVGGNSEPRAVLRTVLSFRLSLAP